MRFEVIHAHDVEHRRRWHRLLERLDPMRVDVHYTPEYARIQDTLGTRTVLCVGSDGDRFILQPITIRTTVLAGEAVTDLESPRGYGGPLAHGWNDPRAPYDAFRAALVEWARSEGAVTERCVFHPFNVGHQAWLTRSLGEPVKPIVYLHLGWDWRAGYSHGRVSDLKAARDAHVRVSRVVPTDKNLSTFSELYGATMLRRHAAPRWFLTEEHISAHFPHFAEDLAELFFAYVGDDVEVATITLRSRCTLHYHLSGSAMKHPKAGANTAMLDALAEHGVDSGCHRLHLGGGATADPDDSLLAYKASFSSLRAPVHVATHVFDDERYRDLCCRIGAPVHTGFFPAYRADEL